MLSVDPTNIMSLKAVERSCFYSKRVDLIVINKIPTIKDMPVPVLPLHHSPPQDAMRVLAFALPQRKTRTSLDAQDVEQDDSDELNSAKESSGSLAESQSDEEADKDLLIAFAKSVREVCGSNSENNDAHLWHADSLDLNLVVSSLRCDQSKLPKSVYSQAVPSMSVEKLPKSIQREFQSLKRSSCCLYGSLNVGDCIDDEWFAVWSLLIASLKFPRVAVQVSDSDGDFLLIETASFLPSWLSPENSGNRVFLMKGAIHVIPPTIPDSHALGLSHNLDPDSFGDPKSLPLTQALGILADSQDGLVATEASEEIQQSMRDAIYSRLPPVSTFGISSEAADPVDSLSSSLSLLPRPTQKLHRASVLLPVNAVRVFHNAPHLVTAAVRAFYYRDPSTMKHIHSLQHFAQSSQTTDSHLEDSMTPYGLQTLVTFTRHAYAMLQGQHFFPLKGWKMPYLASPLYPKAQLGLKLACGLEIILASGLERHDDNFTSNGPTREALGPNYDAYLKKLTQAGFFGEEIKGSHSWNDRERLARETYLGTKSQEKRVYHDILDALEHSVDSRDLVQSGKEDSDDWLNVSAQDVDQLLSSRILQLSDEEEDETNADINEKGAAEQLRNVLTGFDRFLKGNSGIDGVDQEEEYDEYLDDEDSSDDDDNGGSDSDAEDNNFDFSTTDFMQSIAKSLGLTPDECASIQSQYGPELAREFGEVRRAEDDFRQEIRNEVEEEMTERVDEEEGNEASTDSSEDTTNVDADDNLDDDEQKDLHVTMDDIMRAMDSELQQHGLGKEFYRASDDAQKWPSSFDELVDHDEDRKDIYTDDDGDDGEDDEHGFMNMKPLDVNINLIRNLMTSMQDGGISGIDPAGNLLRSARMHSVNEKL